MNADERRSKKAAMLAKTGIQETYGYWLSRVPAWNGNKKNLSRRFYCF